MKWDFPEYPGVPDDLADVRLYNQGVWDAHPERATDEALAAIMTGGFDEDRIRRRVGNYEGQVMAVLRGWATRVGYGWRITPAGLDALRAAGRDIPVPLPAFDSWHGSSDREYCVQEHIHENRRGDKMPTLRLAKDHDAFGEGGYGVPPGNWLLRRADVVVLRDYLNGWLDRTPKED